MPADFKTAARDRFRDSEILFSNKRWTGAVYMARFGLECTLKDMLLRQMRLEVLPQRWYTHDLWKLLKELHKRPIPKSIATALAEINAVDIGIRYNAETFEQETAERFLGRIRGVTRWVRGV